MATVNFFQPGSENAVDAAQVQRQRDIAAALLRQGQSTPQGQMVSGHYVAPAATSYLSQLVSALAGGYKQREADESERELVKKVGARREKETGDFLSAFSGTPGQAARDIPPLTPNDDEGNPMPVARANAVPATPGDPNKALAIGMRSDNPTLQAMAAKLMEQKIQDSAFDTAFGSGAGAGAPVGPPGAPMPPAGLGTGIPASMDGGALPQGAAAMPGAGRNQFLGDNPGQVPTGLARLAFRKDPAEAAKMIMEARKPSNVTEGGSLFDPVTGKPLFTAPKTEAGIGVSGGVASPIPGFAEAQARREGMQAVAREAAKDQFATPTRVDRAGGPVLLTPAQQRDEAGGTLGQRNNNPGNLRPVGANTGFQQFDSPEAGLAAIDQNLQAYGKRGINSIEGVIGRWAPSSENNTAAYVASVAKRLGIDPKQPIDLANPYVRQALGTAIMLHENGTGIITGSARSAGAVAPSGGPGIPLQSDAAKEYETTRAKDFATQASGYQKTRGAASSMLTNLDTLDQLFKDPNVAKGGAAENISGLKNIASSFGLDVKGVGAEQAIQSITNKMALDQRSTADGGGMPGAMSDADRNFLKAQTPGLEKTPEGRALIIGNQRKIAQRQIEVANMANAYERQNGRIDSGFDKQLADYAAANRLFPDAANGASAPRGAAPAAPDLRSLAAQELARRRAKSGG